MQNGNESFRKRKTPLVFFLLWGNPPNPGSPFVALCYSLSRLLKLRGLHGLCSLTLGPTYCSVESLGKVLDAQGTLEVAPYPITILMQSRGSFLPCPTPFLWNTVYSQSPRFLTKALEFVRRERHKGVGCVMAVPRNDDSKLVLVISAFSSARAPS